MNPITHIENPFSLAGETALITGGGSGLGLAIATCMAQAGARVVLAGRRETELQKAATGIGPQASFVTHDVTELDQAGHLVRSATGLAGAPISILVNNAGIRLKKWAVDTSTAEFQSVLQTHVLAAHALTRAVLPEMLARRHGNILFTASMASLFGIPQVIACCKIRHRHRPPGGRRHQHRLLNHPSMKLGLGLLPPATQVRALSFRVTTCPSHGSRGLRACRPPPR